ncbi:hypothetical protein BH10BAC3_BH10BAC3_38460 [soil metagenome]
MVYQKFSPDSILQPYVECYFIWQSGDGQVDDLMFESPPTGFCSIVFNNGEPYFLQNKKYGKREVPAAFIAGQAIYSYKLFFNGPISMAGIVLKPAALATLFNLPAYQYTEERIDLKQVFKPVLIDRITNELKVTADEKQKAKILEAFVMQQFQSAHPLPDYIDDAVNLIIEKNGLLNVNDLLQNIFMSRRNFERRFFKKVGLSPKYYARIFRMAYLFNLIAGKKKVDWSFIFNQCDFYDQSHFIKDFIEFTGRTPQQYLDENMELANFVEKPKQQSL